MSKRFHFELHEPTDKERLRAVEGEIREKEQVVDAFIRRLRKLKQDRRELKKRIATGGAGCTTKS
jgi:hypothetical protein